MKDAVFMRSKDASCIYFLWLFCKNLDLDCIVISILVQNSGMYFFVLTIHLFIQQMCIESVLCTEHCSSTMSNNSGLTGAHILVGEKNKSQPSKKILKEVLKNTNNKGIEVAHNKSVLFRVARSEKMRIM